MRQSFQPLGDCSGPSAYPTICAERPTSDSPHALWITETIQLVVGLAYAYDTIKNNGSNIDRLLLELGPKLDDIRHSLDQINKNIDRLLDIMIDLPKIVRGEVEAAIIKSTLGEADQTIYIIQDIIRDPKILSQNKTRLQTHIDNLQTKMGVITGLRGVSGVLITAPYISVWLSATVSLEKLLIQDDPNHKIDSPWDRNFMKNMSKMFTELFNQAILQDAEFDKILIPSFPPHNRPLNVGNGKFSLSDSTQPGLYRIACPSTFKPERLQVRNHIIPNPGNPNDWIDLPLNANVHQEAVNAFNKFKNQRNEVIAFYDIIPSLDQKKITILEPFIEPKDIWNTNSS